MSKLSKFSCIRCFVEDVVKKHETKFCVVCFVGSDDVLDVVVTDNFEDTILEFCKNNFEDVNKKGFYIRVLSSSSFMKMLEAVKE